MRRTALVKCLVPIVLLAGATWVGAEPPPMAQPPAGEPAVPGPPPQRPAGEPAAAEPAPYFPPAGGCPPLPLVPHTPPRPPAGPQAVSAFVKGLNSTDAVIEILVGQARILTLAEELPRRGKPEAVIAEGDPSVVLATLLTPRQIRLLGLRVGVTDLTITAADGRVYTFEVRVGIDLGLLHSKLQCLFPDASVRLSQVRDQIVVEGEARDAGQVQRIIQAVQGYLASFEPTVFQGGGPPPGPPAGTTPPGTAPPAATAPPGAVPAGTPVPVVVPPALVTPSGVVLPEQALLAAQATVLTPQVVNLLRVPGPQQVLLKVRVLELTRSALRQIGGDFLAIDPGSGAIVGTQNGVAGVAATATAAGRASLTGVASNTLSPSTTLFGIFQEGDFALFLEALRRNSVAKVLAEPNLVALNGHQASFLAGGQFPVPVSTFSGSGAATAATVSFQNFGVQLRFLPFIIDEDTIRLTVDPEVSQPSTTFAATLVPGGSPVPSLVTRQAHTVVELRRGQTLAIAGMMQLTTNASTSRIPLLGDVPILGPFFTNTSVSRDETELLVLVTPYLVEPMNPGQVPPGPGDELKEPNDLEFFLLHRIEGRTGRDFRSTTEYEDRFHILRSLFQLENEHVAGPHGFCDGEAGSR